MPTIAGNVRKRLLMPDLAEATFAKRGFRPGEPQAQWNIENAGTQFLTGFGHAMTGRDAAEVERSLETVERPFRGFAYEGAAMALAITDAITPWGRGRLRRFLAGPAATHVYMVHVGVGWAMARMPRRLWRPMLLPDPLLRWLAIDGYGFHQAYFHTKAHVAEHRAPKLKAPWPDASGYVARAADQGVGRALWFVCCADPERLAATIGGFAHSRRSDLWSGVGLAATYAGGVDSGVLETLVKQAAGYRRELAQGSAFAAKTRLLADLVTPHTPVATRVLCGSTVEEAAAVTDDALADLPPDGPLPSYEVWRQRIQAEFDHIAPGEAGNTRHRDLTGRPGGPRGHGPHDSI